MAYAGKVLVADPNPDFWYIYTEILRMAGFSSVHAGSAEEARTLLENGGVDLVIADVTDRGFRIYCAIISRSPRPPVLVISAERRPVGCDGYLRKPSGPSAVIFEVSRLLDGGQTIGTIGDCAGSDALPRHDDLPRAGP